MDGAAALRRRRAVRQDAGACMYSSRSASLRMYEKDVSNEASEQVSHTQLLLKLRWPKVISKETHSGVLFFGFVWGFNFLQVQYIATSPLFLLSS